MKQPEFLEQHVFTGLKNLNDGFDEASTYYFSESEFETVLQRIKHLGIGLYKIKPYFEGKEYKGTSHEEHNKKATDPRWYKKAFLTLKMTQAGLIYSGTYKVSKRLLAR
jgi:hypothetical protein